MAEGRQPSVIAETLEEAITKISTHINGLIELVNLKRDLLATLKTDIAQMNRDKRILTKEIAQIEEALRVAGIEAEYMKSLAGMRASQLSQAAIQVSQAIQAISPVQVNQADPNLHPQPSTSGQGQEQMEGQMGQMMYPGRHDIMEYH
jgi:chromosome segregation ATPase